MLGLWLVSTICTRNIPFHRFTWVAGDWSFVLLIALKGKFGLTTGSIGFFKSKGGYSSNFPRMCESSATNILDIILPFYRFTYHAITSFPLNLSSLLFLFRLNLYGSRKYICDKLIFSIYQLFVASRELNAINHYLSLCIPL